MKVHCFAIILITSTLFQTNTSNAVSEKLAYCVAVDKIDLNPYREIVDGKDLAYLLLMRSFISTDPEEPGLLSAYEFSPDGRIFTGRINKDLKWPDGSQVLPAELAHVIKTTLPFRTLGERIRVKSTKEIDSTTFQINFDSSIENLTGVIREALSTNSRHNRFWAAKLSKDGKRPMVIGKHPMTGTIINLGNALIELQDRHQCNQPDFTIFAEMLKPGASKFIKNKSPTASALTVQTNPATLSVKERRAVIVELRSLFASAPDDLGIDGVASFFMPGEPGHKPGVEWPTTRIDSCPAKELTLGFEHPFIRSVLDRPGKSCLKLKLVSLPSNEPLDIQIYASGLQEGRHVILQDILKWGTVKATLAGAPKTLKRLEEIAARSASTIPPDNNILSEFEQLAMQEMALAPLARRHPVAHSRASAPAKLLFTSKGELTFKAITQ